MAKSVFFCGVSWRSGVVGIDGEWPQGVPKKWFHRSSFSLAADFFAPFSAVLLDYEWPGVIILAVLSAGRASPGRFRKN